MYGIYVGFIGCRLSSWADATTYRFDFAMSLTGKTFRTHVGHALYVNLLLAQDRAHTSTVSFNFISTVPPFNLICRPEAKIKRPYINGASFYY